MAGSGALRIFHGPSESEGDSELSRIAVELFMDGSQSFAWVYTWEQRGRFSLGPDFKDELIHFFKSISVSGAVLLERPESGAPRDAELLFGNVPEFLDIRENGANFRIRFLGTKHPGLFLDHAPLRTWLMNAKLSGKTVLNTFAYTGSLSVACGLGGASKVTTLDLSKPTTQWGKENWELNFPPLGESASGETSEPTGDFIYGDVFEWLPKLIKRSEKFDVVLLDPPSFSRSPKKIFSTAKDLPGLHALAFKLLQPGGILISSINSAQISASQFRSQIDLAAKEEKRTLKVIAPLAAPPLSFPGADYLKGWIFRVD
ncbi:MAG: class I SAM-dependent rRNA methyltransferase [Cryobacterium sp.]|nr:class I SAM-dependent rRNA methyltransferase [Oligoflexia bacterium]